MSFSLIKLLALSIGASGNLDRSSDIAVLEVALLLDDGAGCKDTVLEFGTVRESREFREVSYELERSNDEEQNGKLTCRQS